MKYSARAKYNPEVGRTVDAERRAFRRPESESATQAPAAKSGDGASEAAKAASVQPESTAKPQTDTPPTTPAATKSVERPTTERRRWERISLAGKRAFATIGNGVEKSYRVLDMSHGGIALEAENDLPAGESFQAVLHVPILGEVRVKLKKLYAQHTLGQQPRVGCLFVT
jgi:hypothetical protein